MKVKEIERTANVAWSPASHHPTYLAAGTAAQQLDATFSTSAALDLYMLDLSDPKLAMPSSGSIPCDHRFNKLVWGSHGIGSPDQPSGHLVGGTDNGEVLIFDPSQIMKKQEALVHKLTKHSGSVTALDFNHFQSNLLASGASESEIYIWDLENPTSPMTPGQKSQPADDVTCVAWNCQVQHILASTFTARCVVWDLRKNEPIIKISDSMSRIKCKLVAWHPDVATQMCLASEDDHTPVVQLWDLRFATSPLKVLEHHERGILSMAWCPQDPDLLMTCGKDSRILCWNPNSNQPGGEVVYELPTSKQWSFDVHWCPRNPAVISTCSFDGQISIYSLMGGDQENAVTPQTTNSQIASSFPDDPFSQQMAQVSSEPRPRSVPLKRPPKWLRPPVGGSFSFGGKLVTFENTVGSTTQPQVARQVVISQVVTETDLIAKSRQLESVISSGEFAEFCSLKIANSSSELEESVWSFLKVNFDSEPRTQFLQLLGYEKCELDRQISGIITGSAVPSGELDLHELSERIGELEPSSVLEKDPFEEVSVSKSQEIDTVGPLSISTDNDVTGLISQAILTGDFESAVDLCLHDDLVAEALILAVSGGPELLSRTQEKYFAKHRSNLTRLISAVVSKNWSELVTTCKLSNWKEALAIVLTYSTADQLPSLCDTLASRLEDQDDSELAINACICYIISGNVERLVRCWLKFSHNDDTPNSLQGLIEKVVVLRQAVSLVKTPDQAADNDDNSVLTSKLCQYAELLATQGKLLTALNYVRDHQQESALVLMNRLCQALGEEHVGGSAAQGRAPWPTASIRAPVGQAKGHQTTTARSQFNTTLSTSDNSYNTPCYNTGMVNGNAPNIQPSAAQPMHSKGSLSSKYPSYPGMTGTGSSYQTGPSPGYLYSPTNTSVSGPHQPAYQDPPQSAYPGTLQSNPYQPYVSGTGSTAAQPATNIYNPLMAANAASQPTSYPSQTEPASTGFTGQAIPGGPNYQPPASTVPSYQDNRQTGAWNDPPIVTGSRRPASGGLHSKGTDQAPPGGPVDYSQMYNPSEYQPPPAPEPQPTPKLIQSQHPAPIEKGQVPSEHQILREIFDKLAGQCLNTATSPQMRRKLEDVLRKLEFLYDKLRGHSLSAPVTLGLHQIVQSIQQYDYQTALQFHTQMVSQGNFSEISSFMPGIKVLVQTATQLQVYVQ